MPTTRIRHHDLRSGSVGSGSLGTDAITGLPADTSPDNADLLLIYRDSSSALRKMSRGDFVAGVPAAGISIPSINNMNITGSTSFAGGALGTSHVASDVGLEAQALEELLSLEVIL